MSVGSILVVSGGLGTGKTTLARALAQAEPTGLHLATDAFYEFPAHLVEPTTSESHEQNATIMKAIGRAAAAFAEGGYDVVLDGIVGPWFLPTLLEEWTNVARVDYVILRATLVEAFARVLRRDGPATSHRVHAMHEAFEEAEGYAGHVLETTGRSAEQVRAELIARRRAGGFAVSAPAAPAPAAKASMLIRKPIAEVFEAFVNPEITTKFWFTRSSGRLEAGKQVQWDWEMYGVSALVSVKAIEPSRRIVVEWPGTDHPSTVEWLFTPRDDGSTFVVITNFGFGGRGDALLRQVRESTEGFALGLAGLKAFLEHGVRLNLVGDRFPRGVEE
jgi:uncharacterized protein YndB with AHSA1/START domain/cytidylate kinase